MTTGVYSLVFGNTYVYIGKSIDIENRWKQHWDKMSKGTAAKNVQEAYNRFGEPKASIVVRCHADHIDLFETIVINHNKHLPLLNAATTVEVNQTDADVLTSNGNLITKSTADHIREIVNLKDHIKELTKTVEKYKYKGIVLPEDISQLKVKARSLETELEAATKAVMYWKAEAQKSWWQKLFS